MRPSTSNTRVSDTVGIVTGRLRGVAVRALAAARHEREDDLRRLPRPAPKAAVDAAVCDERAHAAPSIGVDARAAIEPGLGRRTAVEDLEHAQLAGRRPWSRGPGR